MRCGGEKGRELKCLCWTEQKETSAKLNKRPEGLLFEYVYMSVSTRRAHKARTAAKS